MARIKNIIQHNRCFLEQTKAFALKVPVPHQDSSCTEDAVSHSQTQAQSYPEPKQTFKFIDRTLPQLRIELVLKAQVLAIAARPWQMSVKDRSGLI